MGVPINAPGGEVMLAAGHSITLGDSRDPDIGVVVSAPSGQALNVGRIVADSGKVGIYGALVDQNGAVSATSAVAGADGTILLKSSVATSLGTGSVMCCSVRLRHPSIAALNTASRRSRGMRKWLRNTS